MASWVDTISGNTGVHSGTIVIVKKAFDKCLSFVVADITGLNRLHHAIMIYSLSPLDLKLQFSPCPNVSFYL